MRATLQQRCQQMLAPLRLPDTFDLQLLLDRLTEHRGRPVRLLPLMPGLRDEPSGLWVPLPQEDVIFAEGGVSGWYRDHIVFHEIGHMLWEHLGAVRDVSGWLSQYGMRTQAPTRVALRCSITARQQEREAEMLAILLEARVVQRSGRPLETEAPAEVAEVLERLALALGADRAGA